jgi:hypothetical protein
VTIVAELGYDDAAARRADGRAIAEKESSLNDDCASAKNEVNFVQIILGAHRWRMWVA